MAPTFPGLRILASTSRPRVTSSGLLPRLGEAQLELDAWVKANPKIKLESEAAQKAYAKILNNNRIDRTVTFAGAGTETGITDPLERRGFGSAPSADPVQVWIEDGPSIHGLRAGAAGGLGPTR